MASTRSRTGYNRATPDDQYMTAEDVVHTLVDIVSKNGNFLLDIGPNFDGTIPQVMQDRLRDDGRLAAGQRRVDLRHDVLVADGPAGRACGSR